MTTQIYCPSCGEVTSTDNDVLISPGNVEFTCPECKAEFTIEIQFFPVEKRNEDD